jgi:hypothetical protein
MSNTKVKIAEAGERLANEFQRAIPLDPRSRYGKKPSEAEIQARTQVELAKFYETARAERQKLGLGIIGRARLAFSLQQKLLARGYGATLVKQVLMAMLATVLVGDKR